MEFFVTTVLGRNTERDINFLITYREESRKVSKIFHRIFYNLFDLLYRTRSGKTSKSDNANQANQMNKMNHVTWIEHFKPRLDTSDMSSALDASRDRVQEIHKVQQVREGY